MSLQIEPFLDVDPCRLSSKLTNWTLSSRQASSALKEWSVPDHQYAAQMCQSPERCCSTFHSARRHLMILTQSSRPRFVSSTGNVAVPQHQPSQARTFSTILRRGRQKWEKWRSQRNVPTRNWKMCSSTAPLRASQQGSLHRRQSLSFQEPPSDQRCSSRQAWNQEVLNELRRARNPCDWWTSTRCRIIVLDERRDQHLFCHARRCSYTKVLDRNEKARGIAAPTSVCSASGVLKSAKGGPAPFLYLCSSKSQP